MDESPLKTLLKPSSVKLTDRGSRFYAYAFPLKQENNIELIRSKVSKKHPDATHHCYAWRFHIPPLQEFDSDDGEPRGTAGLPILNAIKSKNLINILVIVVRYFGGTKLGKPGLIQAYRDTAQKALESAKMEQLAYFQTFMLEYPYQVENEVQTLIHRYKMDIGQSSYLDTVKITLYCRTSNASELKRELDRFAHLGISCKTGKETLRPTTSG